MISTYRKSETAIQVCYNMNDADSTFERETQALVKVQQRLSCRRNVIVTPPSGAVMKRTESENRGDSGRKFLLENLM